jgi:mannan endo-1,4-beta-mannosidase
MGACAGAAAGSASVDASSEFTVSSRVGSAPLGAGMSVSRSVAWTAIATSTVTKIEFLIDGALKWTDRVAPYQYKGDPNGVLDTTRLINGTHTLAVKAYAPDGRTAKSSSLVTVSNPAPSPFVGRDGTGLTLGGQPYRFVGINIYMASSGGTPSSCGGALYPDVGVPLSDMPRGVVFRFWAFQNFFVSNGHFDWTNLDRVLAMAAAHGDKVIPVLANQYAYCDGQMKDLAWYKRGYQSTIGPGDIVPYKQYVSAVVARYASNPTVAMWQLVNEGQAVNADGTCHESAALSALLGFSADMGGLVHRLDPNHLVSLGTIAGYSGSGHQWCGAANGHYQTLMASPGSDVCDFHDYGYPSNPMGNPSAPTLATAVRMCHANGKPIMVAETGIYATSDAELAPRAAEFRAKFAAQLDAGVAGELIWCWAVKRAYVFPASDPDYGVFPGDPALGALSAFIRST